MISNAPRSIDANSTSQLNQFEHALKLPVLPKFEDKLSIGIFIFAIAFFTIASAYTSIFNHKQISTSENRQLAPFPQIHTVKKDLRKFAHCFENFYNDRFAFRLPLISVRNFILLKALNSSGDGQVAVGRNDWLYYAVPQAISAQANLQPFTDLDLQLWAHAIQSRKTYLAEHGIKYIFVIPPEKGTIYPENLPFRLSVHSGKTRLDQLQDYLRAHTDVDFIDAKAVLLKAKPGQFPLYHKPDTHWNQYGAFIVVQEMLKHIHAYFPAVEVFAPIEYKVTTDYPFIGDLGKMLGLGHMFAERCMIVQMQQEKGHPDSTAKVAPVPDCWVPSFAWVHPDASLPRVFVLRDSFFGYLNALLAERASFSEFHWNHRLMAPLVLAQKPDIVVDEMAERHLYFYKPENAPEFAVNTTAPAKALLANFEKTFELKNVSVQPYKSDLVVKLQWRSLSKQVFDRKVCLHAMADSGVVLASTEYDQDALGRTVPAFSEWTDTIIIPHGNQQKVTQLGVSLHSVAGISMGAQASKTDWGVARVLLSLKDLDRRNAR